MIPTMIDAYLREHGLRFEHFVHGRAIAAQKLAAAEHVTGTRVAKVVVVNVADLAQPQPVFNAAETMRTAFHARPRRYDLLDVLTSTGHGHYYLLNRNSS